MTDDVRGTVIGSICTKKRYAFYRDGVQVIGSQFFDNDQQAIEWVKKAYPSQLKQVLEMRVWQ